MLLTGVDHLPADAAKAGAEALIGQANRRVELVVGRCHFDVRIDL